MISPWIVAALTLLCAANVFLLYAVACSRKGETDRTAKTGIGFIAAVLVLNTFFSIGGALLW